MASSSEGHISMKKGVARGSCLLCLPQLRRARRLPVRVSDKRQNFFPIPPGCLAPLLPPCYPLTIPFSLASDSVVTYHHRPGTLAAVHFPIHSSCRCCLKRHHSGPQNSECAWHPFLFWLRLGPLAPLHFCVAGAQLRARHAVGEAWVGHNMTGGVLCARSGGRRLTYVIASHLSGHTHD